MKIQRGLLIFSGLVVCAGLALGMAQSLGQKKAEEAPGHEKVKEGGKKKSEGTWFEIEKLHKGGVPWDKALLRKTAAGEELTRIALGGVGGPDKEDREHWRQAVVNKTKSWAVILEHELRGPEKDIKVDVKHIVKLMGPDGKIRWEKKYLRRNLAQPILISEHGETVVVMEYDSWLGEGRNYVGLQIISKWGERKISAEDYGYQYLIRDQKLSPNGRYLGFEVYMPVGTVELKSTTILWDLKTGEKVDLSERMKVGKGILIDHAHDDGRFQFSSADGGPPWKMKPFRKELDR